MTLQEKRRTEFEKQFIENFKEQIAEYSGKGKQPLFSWLDTNKQPEFSRDFLNLLSERDKILLKSIMASLV